MGDWVCRYYDGTAIREGPPLDPSRRFLDAKVRTWVEFLKEQLPLVFRGNRTLVENPTYWA